MSLEPFAREFVPARGVQPEVHTFDLASNVTESLPNLTYHVGDSHITLPRILAKLVAAERHIDFVLADADDSRAGVEADMTTLLHSLALSTSVILLHDRADEGGAREPATRF